MMYRLSSLAIAVPLLLASPAAAQSREQRQMMADIRMLQQQTQQLEVTLGTLTDALHTVSQKLDLQVDVNRKTFADLKLLSDNISADVRVVREKIDETNVRVGSLEQEVQAIQASIQTLRVAPPPSPIPDVPADTAAGGVTPAAPPATAAAPTLPAGTSPRLAYDRADADYQAGQYTLAVLGFEAFIRSFPTAPDAAKAQYYIGESNRNDSKLEQALAAYDKVTTHYANTEWVRQARYKRALVLQMLGRLDAAKAEYEAVVKSYSDTTEGRMATQRLEGLMTPR